ncbi:site-specific integrase [Methylomonas sp. UP202]|uniref:tyrosine-type recombinase/integrase n=1 Tax=Methylomonas sp. UP202 TaxID=3040943 RepID=UPI00247A9D55|nr:site-specific integrase [Methylomonas sp. UP202]WGS86643.1 site-specific integrase [Methylomonas sp. UP202]
MASITKRTSDEGDVSYFVRVRLKGYPLQTATFKRLTDAKKWAASTESAIREGRHFKTNEAKRHTLAEAIDRYQKSVMPQKFRANEVRIRGPILNWWKSQIGHLVLADLSATHFVSCRDTLINHGGNQGRPLAAATIKRHFVAIGHVLKLCQMEWRWMDRNPLKESIIEMPELPRGIVRFLDDDELNRLTAACKESPNPLLYPAFVLAISTGMRQSETMNLYWREPETPPSETAWGVVNLAESCIILHETKNGDRRRVPLASQALAELQKLNKVRRLDSALVFPSPTHPSQPIELKKAWLNALKRAEVNNFRWHDLRHCTASYLAMGGASMVEIAAVLGHKTLDMVKRYSHLSDGHIANVVERMNSRIFGANP